MRVLSRNALLNGRRTFARDLAVMAPRFWQNVLARVSFSVRIHSLLPCGAPALQSGKPLYLEIVQKIDKCRFLSRVVAEFRLVILDIPRGAIGNIQKNKD